MSMLNWTLPSVRTDTPPTPLALSEIALVDVFDMDVKIGTVSGPFATPAASFDVGVLTVGAHAFTVIVQDTTGHRSAASNVASVTIAPTLAPPAAVTDLTFTA